MNHISGTQKGLDVSYTCHKVLQQTSAELNTKKNEAWNITRTTRGANECHGTPLTASEV